MFSYKEIMATILHREACWFMKAHLPSTLGLNSVIVENVVFMTFYLSFWSHEDQLLRPRVAFTSCGMKGNNEKDPSNYNFHIVGQHKRLIASVSSNECNLHSE